MTRVRGLLPLLGLLMLGPNMAYGDFALNFQGAVAANGWTSINTGGGIFLGTCNVGAAGGACNFFGLQNNALNPVPTRDSGGGPDTTPWRYETVSDGVSEYWHMVVGTDPGAGNGFAQDVYIRSGTHWASYMVGNGQIAQVDLISPSDGGSYSDSGGFTSGMKGFNGRGYSETNGGVGSYNAGGGISNIYVTTKPSTCEAYAGNGCDPLGQTAGLDGTWTGNGSGNPTKVAIRQINKDAEMTQEYLKNFEANKPRITQVLTQAGAAGFTASFQADMRGLNYSTMNSPLTVGSNITPISAPPYAAPTGAFVNKMVFNDVNSASGDFNHATSVQAGKSTVTAGRYTWTAGDGSGYGWVNNSCTTWTSASAVCTQPTYYGSYYVGTANIVANDFTPVPIYKTGTYTYFEGNMNPTTLNYKNYMNAAENPFGGKPFK